MEKNLQRAHIIAMGGSVMHALAIALKKRGVHVTGSDDNFFEPSKSRLDEHGLLPEAAGWNPDYIDETIEVVILGMHAHADNPELLKAQELGLKIVSFPEFIHSQSLQKQRIVIGGSHGKTTITSMIMHVLRFHGRKFDYVVGAKVAGFDETVRLSDAPVIIIEGDEYLSSRIDPTPKFLHYHHHIGLISGIAWDHVNVFPREEDYIKQFEIFADASPKAGSLAFNSDDSVTNKIGVKKRADVLQLPYKVHPHEVINGETYLLDGDDKIKVDLFGLHNLANLNGAKELLTRLSITKKDFYEAIQSFELPFLRLDKLSYGDDFTVFRDYAHAPSKVKATVAAVKDLNQNRNLTGLFELHTYSSLNKDFFGRYEGSLTPCDEAIVFYNPKAVEQKKLDPVSAEDIATAFKHSNLKVISNVDDLKDELNGIDLKNRNVLLMSSSNFGELDLSSIF